MNGYVFMRVAHIAVACHSIELKENVYIGIKYEWRCLELQRNNSVEALQIFPCEMLAFYWERFNAVGDQIHC